MTDRELEIRRGEAEAAQAETALATEEARQTAAAAQLHQRLEAARAEAASASKQTGGLGGISEALRALEKLAVPALACAPVRERVLSARAEILKERTRANDSIRQMLQAYAGQLAAAGQQLSSLEAVVAEGVRKVHEAAKKSAVPAPQPMADRPRPAVPPEPSASRSGRTQQRVKMQTAIDLHSDTNFFTGFSMNISDGGVFVATVAHVELGTEVDLRFSLPTGEELNVHGVVRWVREVNDKTPDVFPGVGIQFVNLDPRVQETIHRFVSSRDPMFYAD